MKIYIAAPLYCDYEREYNLKIDLLLRNHGFSTYLPQRDGGCLEKMEDFIDGIDKHTYVFNKDIEAMKQCDVFLFLLDGRVPDEGACVALGYFYSLNKKSVGLKTDDRCLCKNQDNLMIRKTLDQICHNQQELLDYLHTL